MDCPAKRALDLRSRKDGVGRLLRRNVQSRCEIGADQGYAPRLGVGSLSRDVDLDGQILGLSRTSKGGFELTRW